MIIIKNRRLALGLFLLVFMYFGCIRDVNISENNETREVVLNCILNTGKDTVVTWLSYSNPIQSSLKFEAITNAAIQLFEEGKSVGEFIWADSSAYILPLSVQAGKKYRIETKINGERIWAETVVPLPVDATIKIANPENPLKYYQISLTDNLDEKNYYWASASGFTGGGENHWKDIAGELFSDFEYADDFNQYISEDGVFKFEYDFYVRFTDLELPDSTVAVVIYPRGIDYPLEVFLLSTDYHLDKYIKSSLLLLDMELNAEDLPIIYSPFPVYSNIHGGVGIFGSTTSASKIFTRN